ncbi:MAG: glycine zipper family protein [Alphaproteobacteria bacterium]|nr:glycine zipper family protein [Alphaproteobacteria bacterium]
MKKVLLIIFALFVFPCHADVLSDCITAITNPEDTSAESWQNLLFDKTKGIFKEVDDSAEITNDMIQAKKAEIYTAIAGLFLTKCPMSSLIRIIQTNVQRGTIPFTHNGKKYAFDFSIDTMFEYPTTRMAIMVMKKDKVPEPGNTMLLSDTPQTDYFFSKSCSAHNPTLWLSDSTAVNVAGQAVFSEFGGSSNEFFLDFPEGNRRRVFPGLVIMEKTMSTVEELVVYTNLKTAVQKTEAFARNLNGKSCIGQNLGVYLVAIDLQESESSDRDAAVLFSLGGGAATGVVVGLLASSGPVGWIIGAVGAVTAGIIYSVSYEIEQKNEIKILAGPYNIG